MKNSYKSVVWAFLIVTTILLPVKPGISQEISMNLGEINKQSDIILQVQVQSRESKWVYNAAGKNIVTTTRFRVVDPIRGNFHKNDLYSLEMLGGTIGDTSQYVSNSVVFEKDEQSILFLKKDPAYVVGGYQGKYPVVSDQVVVGDQKINNTLFVDALKKSNTNPQALSSFWNPSGRKR